MSEGEYQSLKNAAVESHAELQANLAKSGLKPVDAAGIAGVVIAENTERINGLIDESNRRTRNSAETSFLKRRSGR